MYSQRHAGRAPAPLLPKLLALCGSLGAVFGCDVGGDKLPITSDEGPRLVEPRMGPDVYHPSITLATTGLGPPEVRASARRIKEVVLGSAEAPTCWEGPSGRAQLGVQTEFTVAEFARASAQSVALANLDERLDALFAEGLAVQLLLSIHQIRELPSGWHDVEWAEAASWSNYSGFMPMKPCAEEFVDGERCPYDVLFADFHALVINHLVETGRAERLSVIFIANEFGYSPVEVRDDADDWGGGDDWWSRRSDALAATAERGLNRARAAAGGKVPVGIKLIDVLNANTGWTIPQGDLDPLAHLLVDVMEPSGDVLGYDVYFADRVFDATNRARLAPLLPGFAGGRFAITEFARMCTGLPGELRSGARTTGSDIVDAARIWPAEAGLVLFTFAAHPDDQDSGCLSLADPTDIDHLFAGADDTAGGLWSLLAESTGSARPIPCEDPGSP